MLYIPKIHTVEISEEDVSELKALLDNLDQIEFQHGYDRASLKKSIDRILNQIPRT